MEFVFKPEKLNPEMAGEVAKLLAKRTELVSREKFQKLWEKTDSLNAKREPPELSAKRRPFRRFYGIICTALGIFLLVPGLVEPQELLVPLIVGAVATVTGIIYVLPKKTPEERFEKKAKKLIKSINSALEEGGRVIFSEEGIFENGELIMEYEKLEHAIAGRRMFFFCDGEKLLILRKPDLVSAETEVFEAFINTKTKLIKLDS